ncbi:MAG TPA: hypothetical protein PKA53_12690 [Sphingobacterium sp.]|nr:hypothetical protein [Sphingobacterium sp.]
MINYKIVLYMLATIFLFVSCKREFDSNEDFTSNHPIEIFGDNELLFSKIFRFQSSNSNAYLWFDIRNEIANFSSPYIGLAFVQNGIERYKRLDLRGRIYRYEQATEELTVIGYPLDILTGNDTPTNLVFSFGRKQKEGCENVMDTSQRQQCERTFVLSLKSIHFTEQDIQATVGQDVEHNRRTLKLGVLNQEVFLTN